MSKSKKELTAKNEMQVDEALLLQRVSEIIEKRKNRAQAHINYESVLMFWEVGHHIDSVLLGGERAGYGKQIVVTLSQQLQRKYGSSFEYSNVTRMIKFSARFPDIQIVVTLSQQLSWSHFIALLPLKSDEEFLYYAQEAAGRRLGVRGLRKLISSKTYERKEIANIKLSDESAIPFNAFKDPYVLDVYGLTDNYLEGDLEKAILIGIEKFIAEFGRGITFVARQVRMIMDGEDYKLDLLLYHRVLKRLIAIDLKIGKFKPAYYGQMRFYLKWLNRYERLDDENPPIGLILCPSASREQVELMELDKEGIAVAEFWTQLPPKNELEQKIKEIYQEAKERLERRKSLPSGGDIKRDIDYFYEIKDGEEKL